ncbi:MAG TPA: hypothetical protein PK646_06570 [Bacillota bacterium]|jgi:hypothetical protein|nr:hypothetical protein [Fastidiosipila sp.]HPX93866.1 hypothetical protein [Bacillota bacterium]HQB81731.1 hypothetical protein [Bacillota bacterium]
MNREVNLGRRLAVYVPAFIILSLLQLRMSLDTALPFPDFLLIFPLLVALWTPGYDSFFLGLAAGFIRDYAAGRGYGPGMLAAMILSLCANALAGNGWKNFAVRGGLLLPGATMVHELTMAVYAWLIPLDQNLPSFGTAIKVSFSQLPLKLAANMAGALAVTGFFSLAFYERRAGKEAEGLTGIVREVDHD